MGNFYNSNQPETDYGYRPIDTGKGGGSIDTGKKKKREKEPKENSADKDRKADDAFMNEPNEVRGTESGAYDGLESIDDSHWSPNS